MPALLFTKEDGEKPTARRGLVRFELPQLGVRGRDDARPSAPPLC